MTERDKIRAEAIKQMGSGRMSMAFELGAEYGYNLAIEQAEKWFSEHWREYILYDADNEVGLIGWKGEFKQAMEL